MKKLLICLATLALIAGFGVMKAEAAPTADITVTVTLQNISVSLSDNTWVIGTIAAGSQASKSSVTATNNGNVIEDLTINCGGGTGGVGTTPWTASADLPLGSNEFAMEVQSATTVTNYTLIGGVTAVLFGDNIAAGGTKLFDLRFTAPPADSDYATHTITVTVYAAAAA